MIARNQTFEDVTISLDGGSFYGCSFHRCKLQFSGLLPVILDGSHFDNCHWEFSGPATTTVWFMSALYKAGAHEIVEGTFQAIRGEQTSDGISIRR